MADPKGFLKHGREKEKERPIDERVKDWRELAVPPEEATLRTQASRCMDCGIPFCHQGCPLGNLIPDFNDLVHQGRMDEAVRRLYATNNFPEVTGRVCPAPCEAACVLALEGVPVTIKMIEHAIADHAFASTLAPEPAASTTGKRVAVVGSGPAGLACAQELARKGHEVTVFERDDRLGGLLRYGIPDFKLEKDGIDRRIAQMTAEGVRFVTSARARGPELRENHHAVVLAIGARAPRDLRVPGRELGGVHFAMEFLEQQNRRVAGEDVPEEGAIRATGKRVVVIGGGDTGSDCVGTSVRQGAASVLQLELMPKPPLVRMPENPWPEWPLVLRTSSSHEEGAMRDWAISTKELAGKDGRVTHLVAARVARNAAGKLEELEGPRVEIPCDLVLLAMGFTGPETDLAEELGAARDARGNVASDVRGCTSAAGVFAAGDASRGQSLVVWAIADGRRVARGVDAFLRAATRKSA
jgi:glutamate synthase (NADPH) small chain